MLASFIMFFFSEL